MRHFTQCASIHIQAIRNYSKERTAPSAAVREIGVSFDLHTERHLIIVVEILRRGSHTY
jgi:hypothetical protein